MKKLAASLIISLCCLSGWSQTGLPVFIGDSLDIYVNRALREWQIPGIAVAVIKDGRMAVMKGYGVQDMETGIKIDTNTLFMIGSNTKAFTATALAILDAEKKLSLDDKVQKWLPDFKQYDPWVAKEANIRDLLCHRLGFETFQGDFMYFDSDLTIAEVREKMGKLKPLYGFRSKWGYTNSAFMTAGEIIPKASGRSWAIFLKEKIFQPLGMDRTLALSKEILNATNKAWPHTVVQGKLKKIPYGQLDNLAPAGSISSSVHDLSLWVQMQLNKGSFNGKQVVPASAINETWTPHSILGNGGVPFNRGHFELYGLGWFLEEYEGRKIVSHTGGVNGFVTSITLLPEEKLGIIVLTNTDANSFYEALKMEIRDAYLGLPYRNYSKLMLSRQKFNEATEANADKLKMDTINTRPAMKLDLAAFTGIYRHEVYGTMKIEKKEDHLVATFEHHKGRFADLYPLGNNRMYAIFNDPLFGRKVWPFNIENGKIKNVTVTVADFVEFTPYEFMKQ